VELANDSDDTELIDSDARQAEADQLLKLATHLGHIAGLSRQIETLRAQLDVEALSARSLGASWVQLARAAGIAAPSAQRRWDPLSRERHRDYQRLRQQQREPAGHDD
jgi:hypothetical protein